MTADSAPMRVRFRGLRTGVVAGGLLYPDDVVAAAVKAAAPLVASGAMVGYSPPPRRYNARDGAAAYEGRIEDAVLRITRLWHLGSQVLFNAEVVETRKGRDLRAVIAAGARLGIVMRSEFDTARRRVEGAQANVVTRLVIHGFDIAAGPDGCGVLTVLEGEV